MQGSERRLEGLLEPTLNAMGYELVGVLYRPSPSEGLVRVYIDSEAGISVDDCARVSHQISGILDVEDPVPGRYRLEVSSPGIDRPLFREEHYRRFAGETVTVRLRHRWQERRKIVGQLLGLEDDTVLVAENDHVHRVPLDMIDRANLVSGSA